MAASEHIIARSTSTEKTMLSLIAKHQDRSPSDALRKLIRDAFFNMENEMRTAGQSEPIQTQERSPAS